MQNEKFLNGSKNYELNVNDIIKKILEKPYFNIKDISVLVDHKTKGRQVFFEIQDYIEIKYPKYNRDFKKRVPNKYAVEYLEKHYGFDTEHFFKYDSMIQRSKVV